MSRKMVNASSPEYAEWFIKGDGFAGVPRPTVHKWKIMPYDKTSEISIENTKALITFWVYCLSNDV